MTNTIDDTGNTTLREYQENPFIHSLPPPISLPQLVETLASRPEFSESERGYSPLLRKHCVMRLGRFYEPLDRQIRLAERVDMLLRQGYIGRNPLTHSYLHHLQNGAERIGANSLHAKTMLPVENTAVSFALTGCSGTGKSKSIEKVLNQYPQIIEHSTPFSLLQIVWLKLDCPYQGSPKQLCINFFCAIDSIIGTNYFKWYGSRRAGLDEMMVHMAHLANLHALGVIVIDEIQHLNRSKFGPDALLNFLVTLVNTIGIPVILIGTHSAIPILQENFRQARRACGIGSMFWDRMSKGPSWDYFVDRMWAYQWTTENTPVTTEIRSLLYEESQGILDIVVKLFMLSQLRAINIAEARNGREMLVPELIHQVAKEDFEIVKPMLNAIRDNDSRALAKYDDLIPLQAHFDQALHSGIQTSVSRKFFARGEDFKNDLSTANEDKETLQLISALCALGISSVEAKSLLLEAQAKEPSADPMLLMTIIFDRLKQHPPKLAQSKPARKETSTRFKAGDLREVVQKGRNEKHSAYDALLHSGIIKCPLRDFGE